MVTCVEQKGHLAILIYFTFFGSCFIVSSSFYLVNLEKIVMPNNDPETLCVPGLIQTNSDPGSVVNCADVQEWKFFTYVGIGYGILCLLITLFKLVFIIKKSCCSLTAVITESARPIKPTLRSAAGGKALRKANSGVRRLVMKDQQKRNWSILCSSCGHCLSTCSLFLVVIILWIIAAVVPAFLAVNLYRTDAIRAKEDDLYVPAMALFATCLTSFTTVCVTCAFIIIEADHDGSHNVLDDEESKEIEDPEAAAATQPLRPMTTTTGTTTETTT